MEHIDTIIIGAGQAGLATSYYLQQQGREHLVLERAGSVAPVWRNERWDSFTTVTPNWSLALPGMPYAGPHPEGFLPRDEIVALFETYAARFALPVQTSTPVLSVTPTPDGTFRVATPDRSFLARSVVVATGYEQQPRLPKAAGGLAPTIVSMHSSQYRRPESLPEGAVLVVGSGQTGAQVAEELYLRGRRVYLATSSAGRVPRRYRGKDIVEWLVLTGFFGITPERLPVPRVQFVAPHVSGLNGGRTLNLHQFAQDGVTLLGHLRGAQGHDLTFAPDLHDNLSGADHFEREVLNMVDAYVTEHGLEAPEEDVLLRREGFAQVAPTQLDLNKAGITSIIWATGFQQNYGLVHAPIFAPDGFPEQKRGVTALPGLFFVGMPWMPSLQTGTLMGVGEAAAHIAGSIAAQPGRGQRSTRVLSARWA